MNRHLDDGSLLEAYYLEETTTGSTGRHLSACVDCRRRLESVTAFLSQPDTEPLTESFWEQQGESIQKKIAVAEGTAPLLRRTFHLAAAAILVVVLGSLLMLQSARVVSQPVVSITAAAVAAPAAEELTVPSDPWESEQLKPFSSMVEWESLMDQKMPAGGQS